VAVVQERLEKAEALKDPRKNKRPISRIRDTHIFLTVDVECSVGGAFSHPDRKPVGPERVIYGKNGKESYGLPLLIDILKSNGLSATFFVEVFCSHYFGEEAMAEVCRYLLSRDQDVQLHVHPCWLRFKGGNKTYLDQLSSYTLEEQVRMIAEGKGLLEKWIPHPPIAFRAGNYDANNAMLRALKENHIHLDTSYNLAHPIERPDFGAPINDLAPGEGVVELPVTSFKEIDCGSLVRLKPLEINAVSLKEMKKVIRELKERGTRTVVLNVHPFNFFKRSNNQFTKIWPDKIVIHRFKKLCAFLRSLPEGYKISTFSSFYETFGDRLLEETKEEAFFPRPGVVPLLLRKTVQAVNRIRMV
jgi:hypothetical protein